MPPLPLTAANTTISVKATDIVSAALRDLGILGAGAVLSGTDSQDGLEALQRRVDLTNSQRYLIWAETLPTFNLILNTQPITIGPGGQFVLAAPPVRIESWSLILTGGVEIPGAMLDAPQWAAVSIKNLKSTLPVSLYYERDSAGSPNLGSLYFFPIPTQANQVRLRIWNALGQALALATVLVLPPAYWEYLVCSLAADMAPSFGSQAIERVNSQAFMMKYREARQAITQNNNSAPPIVSDAPSSKRGSAIPDFNFLTGLRQ